MHDDVRVMIKGAKDGILAFVYSIRLTKTLRIKKIQAHLDYLSIATLFNLKLIFIIYTDDTHAWIRNARHIAGCCYSIPIYTTSVRVPSGQEIFVYIPVHVLKGA